MALRFFRATVAILPAITSITSAEDVHPLESDCTGIGISDSISFGWSEGAPFCAVRIKEGRFVNRIRTWAGPQASKFDGSNYKYTEEVHKLGTVHGLEVTYTDGKTTMIGVQEGDWYDDLKWDPEETSVEWMTGWDYTHPDPRWNGMYEEENLWLNAFEVKLTDGQYLCAGARTSEIGFHFCHQEKPSDARNFLGGTLLGLAGAYGTHGLESLRTYTLKTNARNTEIHDVVISPTVQEMNQRANENKGLTQQTLIVGHCVNNLESGNLTFNVAKDSTFTKTKSTTIDVSKTWHVGTELSYEYSWGVPGAASMKAGVKADFSWEQNKGTATTEGETTSQVVKFGTTVSVPPGKAIRVAGYVIEGKMDVTWTGKVTLTMDDGQKFTFPTSGTIKDTLYSDSYMLTSEEDPTEATAAVLNGDGEMLDDDSNNNPSSGSKMARRFIA